MGGGLMQLVAYGAQDIYLTGNPQITFFKVVYRRHTNFSMESIQQTFSGSNGANPVCTISRNGDLVHKMYLVQTTDTYTDRDPQPITTVELEIGGQRIDRQSGQWMDTWNELSTSESKAIGLKAMTGQIGTGAAAVSRVHIPLQFWFCRNPGLALPLIALQYHEVKVKFTLSANAQGGKFELFCDYIYLDTDERRRFAQVSHEYLIEQVQEQSSSTGSNKLNFNHPVKELIWSTATKPSKVGLKLNGHDRFSERGDDYFYLQQPFDYHTAVPAQNLPTAAYVAARAGTTSYTNIITAGKAPFLSATVDTSEGAVTPGTGEVMVTKMNGAAIDGTGDTADTTIYAFLTADLEQTNFVVGAIYLISTKYNDDTPVNQQSLVKCTNVARNTATFTNNNGDTGTAGAECTIVQFDQIIYNNGDAAAVTANSSAGTALTVLSITKVADSGCRTSRDESKIGVYSFALKPEEHQPSGTCNFSRIDNAELTLSGTPGTGFIYAVNYNVLRIMSGMGGLAYSN